MERIVWVDPNLKTNFGHPIEGACSMKNYISGTEKVCIEIVTNKESDDSVQRLLGNVHTVITNTCFQNLDNGGVTFHENLEEIHNKINLGINDLVVIPTAYSNEIFGVKSFLEKHREKQPKFALQIHQFFPPTLTFEQTLDKNYFLTIKKLLTEVFVQTMDSKDVISIWTTQSQKLNRLLNSISPIKISELPLPIEFQKELSVNEKLKGSGATISFLGDGRYEKGLLLFLKAIKHMPDAGEEIIIQDYNSRGYGNQQSSQLKDIKQQLKFDKRVQFIETAVDPVDFQKIIANSDIVVMPYHPQSYDMRVSEVYIIARMYNRRCIVSSGTWMAGESHRFNTGIVFDYRVGKPEQTTDNLRKALEIAAKERFENAIESNKQSTNYKRANSPKNVLRQIMNYYE